MASTPKTSLTHPIRVDWLSTPWAGKVGLTFAPGKKDLSALSGAWDRDVGMDVRRIREHFLADHLLCLLEDYELVELANPSLPEVAIGEGLKFHRLPIADGSTPPDHTAVTRVVADIARWAEGGENVVIHCRGGLGRAGTIGGCVLRAAGLSGEEALADLKRARGDLCPETEAQRRFILSFEPEVLNA